MNERWLVGIIRILAIALWITVIFLYLFFPNPITLWQQQKSINVYSWTEVIDMRQVVEFQKQTGIKVNIGYYESNEELFAKFKVTRGSGYDLIVPSEYMVEPLLQEGLLQKLDKSKLNFWHRLNPRLLNRYYDLNNDYAIPYLWSIYGIGVNTKCLPPDKGVPSWSLLFDQSIPLPRVMIETAREMLLLAIYYLYGSIDAITDEKIKAAEQLLMQQKKLVISYTEVGAPYLLTSGQCPIAVAASPYVLRVVEHNPHIDFIIPREGTFAVLDTLVIPASSEKQDLVYQFINFLYKPETLAFHVNRTYFLPPTTDVACKEVNVSSKKLLMACAKSLTDFEFFRNVIPIDRVNDFWIALKSP